MTLTPGADSPAAGDRYEIVQVDASADRGLIRDLAEHLPEDQGTPHFEKYYRHNPSGSPVVCIAKTREQGQAVGMAALLMSTISVQGNATRAGINADFAVIPEHRGLGPALRLQRAAMTGVGAESLAFVYGCPNPSALPIVKRIGYSKVGTLTSYVKVLKSAPVIKGRVSNSVFARLAPLAGRLIDPMLRLFSKESRTRRPASLRIACPTAFDDERFRSVWASNSRAHTITGERTAELLNWRYDLDADAGSGYEILAVTGPDDQVEGYVVHKTSAGVQHIFDLVCSDFAGAIDTLLAELIARARRQRASRIYFGCLGLSDQVSERLKAFGFRMRDDGTGLYVYPPHLERHGGGDLADPDEWYFVMGDNDVE